MGNINLYKSSSASGPWSLVKENIQSPVTFDEATGGLVYYAVRDEGEGSKIEPSNYKVISEPVYVFKSTDKVNAMVFDDVTNVNSLIIKVTSTCEEVSNHKVQVQINIKDTGWRNLAQISIGSNIQATYTPTKADGITEGSQIKFRAYIFNTTNANYKTNDSIEYTYTLDFNDNGTVPRIDGKMPVDSNGYADSSLTNAFTLYSADNKTNYGRGSAARIPLSFDDIWSLCDDSSNITVTYSYRLLKLGLYSQFKSASFIVTNIFYNKHIAASTTELNFPCKITLRTQTGSYIPDTNTISLIEKHDMNYRILKMCGVEFNCIFFGSYNSSYVCETPVLYTKALPASAGNNDKRIIGVCTTIYMGPYDACGYSPCLVQGDVFYHENVELLKPLHITANRKIRLATNESSDTGSAGYGFLFLA